MHGRGGEGRSAQLFYSPQSRITPRNASRWREKREATRAMEIDLLSADKAKHLPIFLHLTVSHRDRVQCIKRVIAVITSRTRRAL